jgi:NitT/TauT family transport system substrate-binding protein
MAGLATLTGCDSPKPKTPAGQPMESLTLAVSSDPGDLSSLIWVAEDQGYFSQHGLKINVKLSGSGLAATKELVAGNADLATASEFVAASFILKGADIRIITTLCESDDVKLMARRDHGITQISDIRHKRIGVLRGSGGEFFLDLLLVLHRIPSQEVQKVDLTPSEQVMAISKGQVDAVITWDPFVAEVSKDVGTNVVSWSAQSEQNYYWLLLGTADRIAKMPSTIHDFVSSLVAAEEFIKNHRNEAKSIVARKLGSRHRESAWEETQFAVGLDHPLILTMEAEMRWTDTDLEAKQSQIPDLLRFTYFDALNSVKPESIKIVH